MRVAITGSSGLIGGAVQRELRARGDQIVPVRRPQSGVERDSGAVYWDPAAGQIDKAGLEGMDAVVHLAGESIAAVWTPSRKRRIMRSRVQGTTLLARTLAALERPPAVLVTASGINYYGNRPASELVDENTGKGSGFLADVVEAWEGATRPAADAGIRVVHGRFGLVLAKGGGVLKFALPVFYAGLGGKLGSGEQVWSWVAVDDVAGAVRHMIDNPLSGPVNVVAPDPVTNADFTKVLAEVMRRPALMHVPTPMVKLGGGMAEELILSGARITPAKLMASGYRFRQPDLREALQAVLAGEDGS